MVGERKKHKKLMFIFLRFLPPLFLLNPRKKDLFLPWAAQGLLCFIVWRERDINPHESKNTQLNHRIEKTRDSMWTGTEEEFKGVSISVGKKTA